MSAISLMTFNIIDWLPEIAMGVMMMIMSIYVKQYFKDLKKNRTDRDNQIEIMGIQISAMVTALKQGAVSGKQFANIYDREFDRLLDVRFAEKGEMNLRKS